MLTGYEILEPLRSSRGGTFDGPIVDPVCVYFCRVSENNLARQVFHGIRIRTVSEG